ncbi:C39 family peptidase [Thalassotalea euphylliae]|uniref:C39 family peptidase n=1 Tax=Thalassotalea euphylliae TaxID=1655234 RepID=UPI00363D594B
MQTYKLILIIPVLFILIACDEGLDSSSNQSTTFTPDYSDSSAKTLNVSHYRQQTEVWCWAAVIEMVSGYYGRRALQCQTLQFWYGIDCCNFPGNCVTAGSTNQIVNSFNALGIGNYYYPTPLTWSEFVREIDSGRPIIIFYQGSFSGHVVVGFGYNSEKQTMFIHDPYFGTFEVPYGQSFTYSGNMFWNATLAGLAPY